MGLWLWLGLAVVTVHVSALRRRLVVLTNPTVVAFDGRWLGWHVELEESSTRGAIGLADLR